MKKKILKSLASLLFIISTIYANQASALYLYDEKIPPKVKSLRKI